MFRPRHCPHDTCPAHRRGTPFPWRRKGSFRRKVDGRTVPRFLCLSCRRSFSSQTFRLDYRQHRPALDLPVLRALVSKTTIRQTARTLGCRRPAVERRLRRLGEHCRKFHAQRLREALARGGLAGPFVLDELETFERDRKLRPLTVPAVVEAGSSFLVHTEVAPLPVRRPLKPAERRRLERQEEGEGRRRSGSTEAVRATLRRLAETTSPEGLATVVTDRKKTYPGALRHAFGERPYAHVRVSSKAKRDRRNALFPINLCFAMLRDGLSRLVRRSWGVSKRAARLSDHLWVWTAWRNYVRPWKNRPREALRETAATVAGVAMRPLTAAELLRWRVFEGA